MPAHRLGAAANRCAILAFESQGGGVGSRSRGSLRTTQQQLTHPAGARAGVQTHDVFEGNPLEQHPPCRGGRRVLRGPTPSPRASRSQTTRAPAPGTASAATVTPVPPSVAGAWRTARQRPTSGTGWIGGGARYLDIGHILYPGGSAPVPVENTAAPEVEGPMQLDLLKYLATV